MTPLFHKDEASRTRRRIEASFCAAMALPVPVRTVTASRSVRLGQSVFTIGFPNTGLQGFQPKFTKGEISSLMGLQDDPRQFQVSVPVQPGNSGGPLVDEYGNIVGMVTAKLSDVPALRTSGAVPQNVNYAVKSSLLSVMLEGVPQLSAKARPANVDKNRQIDDVIQQTCEATVLVLVY